MTSPLLLGVDAGSSRIRALIFTLEGDIVAEGSVTPPLETPHPGWATLDADQLWQACWQAIRRAVREIDDPKRVRSVAITSVGEAGVPLGEDDRPLHPIIAWYDTRTKPQAQRLAEKLGEQRLFETTGLNISPIYTLCKQLWLREHQPNVFKSTRRWLHTADYLAWRLCGVPATDYSLASRTFALDIRSLQLARGLLEEVGIPPSWYQEFVPSGTRLGTILPDVAEATGLSRDCVVSAGGHDHLIGSMVAGALTPGTLVNSMGTAEGVTIFMDKPLNDPTLGHQGYAQGVVVTTDRPYYYLVGGLFTSGGAVQWFHQLTEQRYSHEQLIEEASKIKPGCDGLLFMPHLRMGSPPNAVEQSRGAFLGFGTYTNHWQMYRSILEGMACDIRMITEAMIKPLPENSVQRIHCTGGESQNRMLMQIKSAVLNRPLQRLQMTEAVSLGAALLGGIGAGLFKNLEEALAGLSYGADTVEPDPAMVNAYQAHYAQIYSPAWQLLQPMQERLQQLYPVSLD